MAEKKVKKPKCPNCGSSEYVWVSYDGKDVSYVCDYCGHNWKPRVRKYD